MKNNSPHRRAGKPQRAHALPAGTVRLGEKLPRMRGGVFLRSVSGDSACWCDDYPHPVRSPEPWSAMPLPTRCLAVAMKPHVGEIRRRAVEAGQPWLVNGPAMRFDRPGVFIEHLDFYREGDRVVFTEWYHLKRGRCCESGCRHCPYGKK